MHSQVSFWMNLPTFTHRFFKKRLIPWGQEKKRKRKTLCSRCYTPKSLWFPQRTYWFPIHGHTDFPSNGHRHRTPLVVRQGIIYLFSPLNLSFFLPARINDTIFCLCDTCRTVTHYLLNVAHALVGSQMKEERRHNFSIGYKQDSSILQMFVDSWSQL